MIRQDIMDGIARALSKLTPKVPFSVSGIRVSRLGEDDTPEEAVVREVMEENDPTVMQVECNVQYERPLDCITITIDVDKD